MKNSFLTLTAAALACALSAPQLAASPEADQKTFHAYFTERFPNVPVEEFKNGVYAIDPVGRENWEAIEEFPPYETAIDNGQEMWDKPFANGKTYKDCFPDGRSRFDFAVQDDGQLPANVFPRNLTKTLGALGAKAEQDHPLTVFAPRRCGIADIVGPHARATLDQEIAFDRFLAGLSFFRLFHLETRRWTEVFRIG